MCLTALEAISPEGEWLSGATLSLADLHAAPMFHLFAEAPEFDELMSSHPRLLRWAERIKTATQPAGLFER